MHSPHLFICFLWDIDEIIVTDSLVLTNTLSYTQLSGTVHCKAIGSFGKRIF